MRNKLTLLVYFSVLLIEFVYSDDFCTTPNNKAGTCVVVNQCAYFQNILRESSKPSMVVYDLMRQSICGFEGRASKICCPALEVSTSTITPSSLIPSTQAPSVITTPTSLPTTSGQPSLPSTLAPLVTTPIPLPITSSPPSLPPTQAPSVTTTPISLSITSLPPTLAPLVTTTPISLPTTSGSLPQPITQAPLNISTPAPSTNTTNPPPLPSTQAPTTPPTSTSPPLTTTTPPQLSTAQPLLTTPTPLSSSSTPVSTTTEQSILAGQYREPPPSIEGLSSIELLPTDCGEIEGNRIFNGFTTGPLDYPWMALLSYDRNGTREFMCGGTIINERYILTAAHCIASLAQGITLLGVRVGEHNLATNPDCENANLTDTCVPPYQDMQIESVIPHPDFNITGYRDDIGLIRLARAIDMSQINTMAICLPTRREIMEDTGADRIMRITGWGLIEDRTSTQELIEVDVPVLNNTICGEIYNVSLQVGISYKQMCAGGNTGRSCRGDSGGPMITDEVVNGVIRYVQHGIISFGYRTCESLAPIPGVLTRVAYYMDWILNQLRP